MASSISTAVSPEGERRSDRPNADSQISAVAPAAKIKISPGAVKALARNAG
ncbi:hypothetical protein BDIM_00920 [Brevundimonas diminuta ATCC 11568]|nr:hypothetical protein BDIM_00920 [Brevundimonas diminuta ATCC 11568]